MSDNQFVQSIEVGKCIDADFQPAVSLAVKLKLSPKRMANEFAMNGNLDSLEQELGTGIVKVLLRLVSYDLIVDHYLGEL